MLINLLICLLPQGYRYQKKILKKVSISFLSLPPPSSRKLIVYGIMNSYLVPNFLKMDIRFTWIRAWFDGVAIWWTWLSLRMASLTTFTIAFSCSFWLDQICFHLFFLCKSSETVNLWYSAPILFVILLCFGGGGWLWTTKGKRKNNLWLPLFFSCFWSIITSTLRLAISHILIVCCWCNQLKEEAKSSEGSYYSTAQDVKSD